MSLAMTHSLLQLCHWAALWIMHYKLRLPLLTPVSCFHTLATEAFLQTSSLSQRNLANILPLTHIVGLFFFLISHRKSVEVQRKESNGL